MTINDLMQRLDNKRIGRDSFKYHWDNFKKELQSDRSLFNLRYFREGKNYLILCGILDGFEILNFINKEERSEVKLDINRFVFKFYEENISKSSRM